jgi:hypothetical protein
MQASELIIEPAGAARPERTTRDCGCVERNRSYKKTADQQSPAKVFLFHMLPST